MSALKAILAPGSLALLAAAVAIGSVARARSDRLRRTANIWIASWLMAYAFLSLPIVARALSWGLTSTSQPFSLERAPDADVIVVLVSGAVRVRWAGQVEDVLTVSTALRVAEAVRVYRLLRSPDVILSGGGPEGPATPAVQAMLVEPLDSGVPRDRIIVEAGSRDTHQSAEAVRRLLSAQSVRGVVLITSADHMPRAWRAYRAAGTIAVPAPAPGPRGGSGWSQLIPNTGALQSSERSLHEYVGLLYYRLRGWT